MSEEQVTVAEEEYLQILYWLHEAGLPMTAANIARAMQLSAPTVHEMIGRLEHAMSPVLEERMRAAIGTAKTCPHGHPIRAGTRVEGVPLADVEVGASVQVLRFENEAEDVLIYLREAGLDPGQHGVMVANDDEEVAFEAAGDRHAVTRSVAETVSVLADPSPPARTALPEQLVLGKDRYGR